MNEKKERDICLKLNYIALLLSMGIFIIGCAANSIQSSEVVAIDAWTESNEAVRFLKTETDLVSNYSFLAYERTIGNLNTERFDNNVFQLVERMLKEEQYLAAFSVIMHMRNTEFPLLPDKKSDPIQYVSHTHSNSWISIEKAIIEGLFKQEKYQDGFMAAKEFGDTPRMDEALTLLRSEYKSEPNKTRRKSLFDSIKNITHIRDLADPNTDPLFPDLTQRGDINSGEHFSFKRRIELLEKLDPLPDAYNYYDVGANYPVNYILIKRHIVDALKSLSDTEFEEVKPDGHYCHSPVYIESYVEAGGPRVNFTLESAKEHLYGGEYYCSEEDVLDAVFYTVVTLPGGRKGVGTSFKIDKKGYFLTNYHVIKDRADDNSVELSQTKNSSRKKATVISYDEDRDIALLYIADFENNAHNARALSLYPYFVRLSEGMKVIALGNPKSEDGVITKGKVENAQIWINQGLREMFYHSAATNNGNSGGPILLNHHEDRASSGEKGLTHVLGGIAAAIINRDQIGSENRNAAIPIDRVIGHLFRFRLIPESSGKDPWIGAVIGNTAGDRAIVTYVFRNSPAERAGLKPGMRIKKIQDQPISERKELEYFLQRNGEFNTLYRLEVEYTGQDGTTKNEERYVVVEKRPKIDFSLFANDHPGSYIGTWYGFVSYKNRVYYSEAMQTWHPIYVIDEITEEKPRELFSEELYSVGNSFLIKSTDLIYQTGSNTEGADSRLKITLNFVNFVKMQIEGVVRFGSLHYGSFSDLII